MKYYLQLIDELTLPDHFFIDPSDECYFIFTHISNVSYEHSSENQIMFNFKKSPRFNKSYAWRYKLEAIMIYANRLKSIDIANTISDDITIIPIPPSKIASDPEYDDRVTQVLNKAYKGSIDIRELIKQRVSKTPSHLTNDRRNISVLIDNYYIDEDLANGVKDTIVIFDDVITTGAHFKAIKRMLRLRYPDKKIIGLFLARRIFLD